MWKNICIFLSWILLEPHLFCLLLKWRNKIRGIADFKYIIYIRSFLHVISLTNRNENYAQKEGNWKRLEKQ